MPLKGARASGSGKGSVAWNRAKAGGSKPPDLGVPPAAPKPARARPEDEVARVEWPDHAAMTERALADATVATAFKMIECRNLGTDAEIASLKAERARLIKQCEDAGVDTDPNAPPTVVRALHPSAVVLPTLIGGPCASCVELKRGIKEAEALRARTEYKYVVMRERYLEMVKTQEEYRHKFDRLELSLSAAHERLGRPAGPPLGHAHTPKKHEEEPL